jgi:hypothetical protein
MLMKNQILEFHGYIGHLVRLKDGATVKILGGQNLKLFVRTIDGTITECYHNDIDFIWDK